MTKEKLMETFVNFQNALQKYDAAQVYAEVGEWPPTNEGSKRRKHNTDLNTLLNRLDSKILDIHCIIECLPEKDF